MKINKKQLIKELEQRKNIYKHLLDVVNGDTEIETYKGWVDVYDIINELQDILTHLIDETK